jgi:mRNA interferase RelE/StbE
VTEPQPYEVALSSPARRALAERLPLDVAVGVWNFLKGQLAENPYRVGKELDAPMSGVY